MGKVGEETTCDIGGFKFTQGFVKVTNTFIGRCATSPVHVNFDVTPVILYVCERQGSHDGGSMFYNMDYGFGVNLIENMTIVFFPDHVHGTTVLNDNVILNGLTQSVTLSTLCALKRYDMYIEPHSLSL